MIPVIVAAAAQTQAPSLILHIAAVVVLAVIFSLLIIMVGPDRIDGFDRYNNNDIS